MDNSIKIAAAVAAIFVLKTFLNRIYYANRSPRTSSRILFWLLGAGVGLLVWGSIRLFK